MITKKILKYLKILGSIIHTLPSRIIFGNTVQLKFNLLPMLDNLRTKSTSKKFNPINENGFLKINNSSDKELLDKIVTKYNKYIDDPNFSSITANLKKKFLLDPVKNIPELKMLIPTIKDHLIDYYGNDFVIKQVRAFRNYSDESISWEREKYIYSNLWHCDDFKTNILKVFVLLNDKINKDTGCTRVIDRKNSSKLMRSFKFKHTSLVNRKFDDYVVRNKLITYCEGNIGDVFIINTTQCLHAASIPKLDVHRDVVVFETYPVTNLKKDLFDLSHDEEVHSHLRPN